MIDNLISSVQRPSRYLGNEINVPQKDWASARVRMVLAFPDVYEIGMSHLGLLLLYDILNQHGWIGAERVFAVWPDMEAALRTAGRPLVSLESGTPLAMFDVVGFSLQYELSYTNVLTMLELGGIAPLAAARKREQPLVIGGGPNAFNPEPAAVFFDAFVLGDGEEVVLEIAEVVDQWKTQGSARLDVLKALSELEGVYVPSFFQPRYDNQDRLVEIRPRFPEKPRARKRILPTLDSNRSPSRPLVPCTRIIHDRLSLEAARGCTRGCRFCQAGFIYRPVRERSPREILKLAEAGLDSTGHDELSLLALSVGDYGNIQRLLQTLMQYHRNRQVAISLPSLRVGTLDEEMIEAIKQVRKTGFTLAPEAGSERLRCVINKGISESDLLDTVREVYSAGWRLIKLYFMMGLPTERAEDLEALVALTMKVWREAATHKPPRRLHVSDSTFVPKPHTPFQWEAQLSLAEIEKNLAFFKRSLRKKGLHFKWHKPWQSVLEGVFSRGDRRLGEVLLRAQQLGCRFDGWSDQLRVDLWQQAFAEAGIDPLIYGQRSRDFGEILPWSHLDCGVSEDYLWKEYERAIAEVVTADCRTEGCNKCGVCDHKTVKLQLHQEMTTETGESRGSADSAAGLYRYHMVFAKIDNGRFLSHLEMATVFQRAMRRAGLPLAYSQGYHPTPRISFGDALPLGLESRVEEMEVVLRQPLTTSEICSRLNAELPPGLEVLEAEEKHKSTRQTASTVIRYEAILPGESWPAEGFRRFHSHSLAPLRQRSKRGETIISLEDRLLSLESLDPHRIRLTLTQDANGNIRIRDLLTHIFDLPEQKILDARIIKVSSELTEG
ncbi:MAG: TIGR03960 family B12-binding radical SAM protein [Syntrophobacteria bacterium]